MKEKIKLWIAYSTDGDSGWYKVRIFTTREEAEKYKKEKLQEGYGRVDEIEVD